MNPSSHPIDRTAEAARIRGEGDLNETQELALNALSKKTSKDSSPPPPPVPEALRDRWRDRYGESRTTETAPKENLSARLQNFLRSPIFALGVLGTAAAAVIAISFTPERPATSQEPVMRGVPQPQRAIDPVIIYIASPEVSFLDFFETRAGGLVLETSKLESAEQLIIERGIQDALILDVPNSQAFTYKGILSTGIPLELNHPDEFDLSEIADDLIQQEFN